MEMNELSAVGATENVCFITKAQLVEKSSLSLATINRYIKRGVIPVARLGRRVLIDIDFLNQLKRRSALTVKEEEK